MRDGGGLLRRYRRTPPEKGVGESSASLPPYGDQTNSMRAVNIPLSICTHQAATRTAKPAAYLVDSLKLVPLKVAPAHIFELYTVARQAQQMRSATLTVMQHSASTLMYRNRLHTINKPRTTVATAVVLLNWCSHDCERHGNELDHREDDGEVGRVDEADFPHVKVSRPGLRWTRSVFLLTWLEASYTTKTKIQGGESENIYNNNNNNNIRIIIIERTLHKRKSIEFDFSRGRNRRGAVYYLWVQRTRV
eukprot:gene6094-4384_t